MSQNLAPNILPSSLIMDCRARVILLSDSLKVRRKVFTYLRSSFRKSTRRSMLASCMVKVVVCMLLCYLLNKSVTKSRSVNNSDPHTTARILAYVSTHLGKISFTFKSKLDFLSTNTRTLRIILVVQNCF